MSQHEIIQRIERCEDKALALSEAGHYEIADVWRKASLMWIDQLRVLFG